MNNNGWIKLHRKMLDNPISNKPKYAWVWITLLLKANHKENKIMWNGNILIIKEGQVLTGRKELSKQTGISESTLEDILKYLEKQQQIQQQKTTKFRIITIVKWEDYQNSDTKTNNKATTKQQQSDTNNNDNNVNKKKEDTPKLSKQIVDTLLKEMNLIRPDGDYLLDNLYPAKTIAKRLTEWLNNANNEKKEYSDIEILDNFKGMLHKMDNFHRKNTTNIKYIVNNFNKIINQII